MCKRNSPLQCSQSLHHVINGLRLKLRPISPNPENIWIILTSYALDEPNRPAAGLSSCGNLWSRM